jgi:hypothetical protein
MRPYIIAIAVIIVIVVGVFFFRVYYPGSELELKHLGNAMEIPALVDYYKLDKTEQCGTWYGDRRNQEDAIKTGNMGALNCFDTGVVACERHGILAISEGALSKEYSFLRVLGKNEKGQCVIQNSYYYKDDKLAAPEMWINTCIKLDPKNLWRSCMPDFLKNQ